jgi:hypothetical protein
MVVHGNRGSTGPKGVLARGGGRQGDFNRRSPQGELQPGGGDPGVLRTGGGERQGGTSTGGVPPRQGDPQGIRG